MWGPGPRIYSLQTPQGLSRLLRPMFPWFGMKMLNFHEGVARLPRILNFLIPFSNFL